MLANYSPIFHPALSGWVSSFTLHPDEPRLCSSPFLPLDISNWIASLLCFLLRQHVSLELQLLLFKLWSSNNHHLPNQYYLGSWRHEGSAIHVSVPGNFSQLLLGRYTPNKGNFQSKQGLLLMSGMRLNILGSLLQNSFVRVILPHWPQSCGHYPKSHAKLTVRLLWSDLSSWLHSGTGTAYSHHQPTRPNLWLIQWWTMYAITVIE